MQDTNQFVATYDSLKTVIYDVETGKILTQFVNENSTSDSNYRINRIISHPSQPIIITAHEDRKIRYFDSNSGNQRKILNHFQENMGVSFFVQVE
jgi:striatin 1/3/4